MPFLSLRMSFLKVLLCVLVLGSPRSEAAQPNCTGVADFQACQGTDPEQFCPRDIACQCKNGEPFCRCEYYRIGWKEYWYMGPKCNQVWNTLNFILVATLPAGVLVLTVVVVFSALYFLKIKKSGKQPEPPCRGAQQNPAFSLEQGHLQPPRHLTPYTQDAWVGQIPKVALKRQDFNDASIPDRRESYSPIYAEPLRPADPASEYSPQARAQWDEFGYPRKDFPYPVYPEARQSRRY